MVYLLISGDDWCGASLINHIKYNGASEWKALKTNSKILNSMRLFIGSQCRSRRTGVMCSRLGVLFIMQAVAFCASCSRCIDFIGRPIQDTRYKIQDTLFQARSP